MSHEVKHAVLMAKHQSVTLIVDDMCELNFRHCATNRKVAGSIADGVIGIFL
jgi:hypothetical protein